MSATNYFFVASLLFTLSLFAYALNAGFEFKEMSFLGQKVQFNKSINIEARKKFVIVSGVLFFVSISLGILGVRETLIPAEERARFFRYLDHAELQASQVDDIVTILVNGRQVVHATYHQPPLWVDITKFMENGTNSVETIIQNGLYGGCGARVRIKINGLILYNWEWGTAKGDTTNKMPNVVCYQEVRPVDFE